MVPIKTPIGYLVDVNKLILTFTWRSQRPRIADTVLKEGNKVGTPMMPNFKTYCRASVGTSGKSELYTWDKSCMCAKSFQSCPTLCDPMDHSLPGSSVHGVLQARILEKVAISSFRGSSQPRD